MPVTKGVGVRIPSSNQVVVVTSITLFDAEGGEIGFVSELGYRTARTVERIRHLNAADAGRILEQCPLPEDFTLDASGMALYDSTLIGRLSKGSDEAVPPDVYHAINTQYGPFTIEVLMTHPTNSKQVRVVFGDCWIASFDSPMRVGTANIVQRATMQPSWVETELPEWADIMA